jgi:hypothetical protein
LLICWILNVKILLIFFISFILRICFLYPMQWSFGILELGCPSVCRRNGFRALERYPYHIESPYHTYRLSMEGRCTILILSTILILRSSALDIKVEIWFLGFRPLSLPPRVTISHILTTHGRRMFFLILG